MVELVVGVVETNVMGRRGDACRGGGNLSCEACGDPGWGRFGRMNGWGWASLRAASEVWRSVGFLVLIEIGCETARSRSSGELRTRGRHKTTLGVFRCRLRCITPYGYYLGTTGRYLCT